MKLIKRIRNKKGYSAINVVVAVLAIIMCFSLLVEFIMVGYRYSHMSQTSTYIARVIGEQGGISNSVPPGWPSNRQYITSSNLRNTLNQGFFDARFTTWRVRVNGNTLNGSSNFRVPEQERIEVEVTAGFRPVFDFMGASSRIIDVTSTRTNYSTFTPRTDELTLIK